MQIYLPKRQLEQPKNLASINSNNPLADKLIFAWIPGAPGDLVYGRNFAINNRAEKVTQFGRCTDPTSTTTEKRFANFTSASDPLALLYDDQSITIFGIFRQATETGSGFCFLRANGTGTATWHLGLHGGTFDGPTARLGNYSYTPATGDSTMVGKPHTVCITGDGSTLDLFYDKTQIISGQAYAPTTPEYNTTKRSVLIGNNGSGSGVNTECYLALAFRGKISADKYYELQRNPWQLFTTQKRVIYFDVLNSNVNANATGSTLLVNSSILAGIPSIPANISSQILTTTATLLYGNAAGNVLINSNILETPTYIVAGTPSAYATVNGSVLTASNTIIPGTVSIAADVSGSTLTSADYIIAGTASSNGIGNANGATLFSTSAIIAGTVSVNGNAQGALLTTPTSLIAGNALIAANIAGVTLTSISSILAGNVTINANTSGAILTTTALILEGSVSIPTSVLGTVFNSNPILLAGTASAILSGYANGSTLITDTSLLNGIVTIPANITGKVFLLNATLLPGTNTIVDSIDLVNRSTGSSSKNILGSKSLTHTQASKHYEH